MQIFTINFSNKWQHLELHLQEVLPYHLHSRVVFQFEKIENKTSKYINNNCFSSNNFLLPSVIPYTNACLYVYILIFLYVCRRNLLACQPLQRLYGARWADNFSIAFSTCGIFRTF